MVLLNTINNSNIPNNSSLDQSVNDQQFGTNYAYIPASGGDAGLPSGQITPLQAGKFTRNIIHWFVPEVGVVNMYINPQNINYSMKKLITPQRTKGGYNVQYWGEELMTLTITGHTGSSGFEGLNVLQEVYRSEQILFNPVAQTMASANSISGVNDLVDGALGNLTSIGQTLSGLTGGVVSLNPQTQNILPQNIPSLASMALGIEMYYTGLVYRGFFTSFGFSESTQTMGLFNYDIGFTVTQTRGYRTNSFAFQRSANSGPSNNSPGGIPLSFSGSLK